MKTKYTPGPWFVWEGSVYAGIPKVKKRGYLKGYDAKICAIDDMYGTVRARKANARLIAAAPDLLEALQWYEAKAVQMGRAAIDQDSKLLLELMKEIAVEYGAQARAAIAKATGEQP